MSSPAEIATDLADVSELLSAQVGAGLNRDDVLLSLFNSWSQRLAGVARMQAKGKTLVTTAIQNGPWTPEQKKELASIVLGSGENMSAKAIQRRATQKMHNPENFVRMATMIKLRDPNLARASRMSVLAAEVRNIGIENPDEKTLYKLVQMLAYLENNFDFTQDLVWSCMDDLQAFIKSVPRHKDLPYLTHYPATAQLLDAEVKAVSYPEGEPVAVDIPELSGVLGSTKMRGRPQSKHAEKAPKWLSHVPADMRSAVMGALKDLTKPGKTSTTSEPSNPALSVPPLAEAAKQISLDTFRFQAPPALKPAKSAAPEVKTHEDDDEENETEDEKSDSEEAGTNTIDELEKTMLSARGKARAVKKDKKKGSEAIMKRPAGVVKRPAGVLKRPAGVVKPQPVKKEEPTTKKKPAAAAGKCVPKNATWKNIHSKIYHKIRDAIYMETGDDAKAKNAASEACARAKVKFLKGTLKV